MSDAHSLSSAGELASMARVGLDLGGGDGSVSGGMSAAAVLALQPQHMRVGTVKITAWNVQSAQALHCLSAAFHHALLYDAGVPVLVDPIQDGVYGLHTTLGIWGLVC